MVRSCRRPCVSAGAGHDGRAAPLAARRRGAGANHGPGHPAPAARRGRAPGPLAGRGPAVRRRGRRLPRPARPVQSAADVQLAEAARRTNSGARLFSSSSTLGLAPSTNVRCSGGAGVRGGDSARFRNAPSMSGLDPASTPPTFGKRLGGQGLLRHPRASRLGAWPLAICREGAYPDPR